MNQNVTTRRANGIHSRVPRVVHVTRELVTAPFTDVPMDFVQAPWAHGERPDRNGYSPRVPVAAATTGIASIVVCVASAEFASPPKGSRCPSTTCSFPLSFGWKPVGMETILRAKPLNELHRIVP